MSIRRVTPDRASGRMSCMKPGSRPEVKQVVPPSRQAASRRRTISWSALPGWTSGMIAVDTTLMPARSRSHIWSAASDWRLPVVTPSRPDVPAEQKETQSGFSAISASPSSVAMMPVGVSRPQISAASLPTLAGSLTTSPTSSSSGWLMIERSAFFPTLPVAHWPTRIAMTVLSLFVLPEKGRRITAPPFHRLEAGRLLAPAGSRPRSQKLTLRSRPKRRGGA
ncbi:hypothetical protein ACFSTI_14070 [Rhizorhabdus histidinilytica]